MTQWLFRGITAAFLIANGVPVTAVAQTNLPMQLDVRAAGARSLRITYKPVDFTNTFPEHPAVVDRAYAAPALSLRDFSKPASATVSGLRVSVKVDPLTVSISRSNGAIVQELVFSSSNTVGFALDSNPVLGMGEGGPRPARGTPWRQQPVQYDRRGALDEMQPRWQSDMYGSRNPVAMLWGTSGWGLFVPTPWMQVDLRQSDSGIFIPWKPTPQDLTPQNERNQQQAASKGLPPADKVVPGLVDLFVFDAQDPAAALQDFSQITGPASMPPKWALGYMQSHRTLEDDAQMTKIVDTFREKQIPVDAVIYLGTGFVPQGWNTRQPSFTFNPEVFKRDPKAVLGYMHSNHVRVVVHMVPWDRDRLPTLHGSIPAKPGETLDAAHIQNYWQQHVPLVEAGVDAFWPDEGDWFNLFERIKRHQLYYQGGLSTRPNERPWSLQRNGYPGIAQWGGWVWSGDTESSWKTLEAQVAVGINYSLSIGPYWGSDIGGFYPNSEYTGELYARWHQFAAFCGSFRSHGRVWWTHLPWGWGGNDRGPQEYGNRNQALATNDPRNILMSEMNNPTIEPVVKKYSELRYQLMPYTYTLAWEARERGLPVMRALWLHYPDDTTARGVGGEYLWGRDLLVAPVFTKGAKTRDVYLPKGEWYDWWTNEKHTGGRTVSRTVDLATMPIYVRAGAIVPVDPVRQYTSQTVTEPTTINVYPGANGTFTLYEDDGITQQYLQNRGTTLTKFTWNDGASTLTIEPGASSGANQNRTFQARVLPSGTIQKVDYRGNRVQVSLR
jgi:alpha-glucosidase (family GH31 glycosyl hydrolase)